VKDSAALVSPLAEELEKLAVTTYQQARSAVALILGASVLLVGVAMIVLPGSAIVIVPSGLVFLAVEFALAWRWLRRVSMKIASGGAVVSHRRQ